MLLLLQVFPTSLAYLSADRQECWGFLTGQMKERVTMTNILLYLLLGLVAGTFSGLIGIGGGTIIVPALVFLFGLSQHHAQGTTLALLVPPIGLLAAWTY